MYVSLERKYKDVLLEIIPLFAERIFSTWHVTPQFAVIDGEDEDVVFLNLEYNDGTGRETENRHIAMDIALAFIDGYLSHKSKSL